MNSERNCHQVIIQYSAEHIPEHAQLAPKIKGR